MLRILLLKPKYTEELKDKLKKYNRLLAKKYILKTATEELNETISNMNAEIKLFLEEYNFDYLEDLDVNQIKQELSEDDPIYMLLNNNILHKSDIEKLITLCSNEHIQAIEKLERFLKLALRNNMDVVLYNY
jgi:hypothetical protein